MNKRLWGYAGHFILLHVITYVVVGMVCMQLQNYDEAMATMETFKHYRTLEDPVLAALLIPTQIIRGGILSLLLYPFYKKLIRKKRGWLLLFALLYGFTFGITIFPGIIFDFVKTITTEASVADLLFGSLEVTVQMFVFSWLFYKWEKRRYIKTNG